MTNQDNSTKSLPAFM